MINVRIGPYDVEQKIKEKIDKFNKKTGISKNRIAQDAFEFYFKNQENKKKEE